MAKKEEKKTRQDITAARGNVTGAIGDVNARSEPIRAGIASDLETQKGIEGRVTPSLEAGYGDLATTGGVSPEYANAVRNRTASGISRSFDALKRNVNQRRSIQGGYSPGGITASNDLARQNAIAQGENLRDTDIGLIDQTTKGKLAGLAGQSNLRSQLPASTQIRAQQLQEMGLTGDQIARLLGIDASLLGQQAGLATRPGIFDNILRAGQAAAGGIAGIAGGFNPGRG